MSQLKQFYEEEVAPKLTETFGYKNAMQVPMLKKVVLNMGLGEAIQNIKLLDSAVEELKVISGQKPVITRAKRSIAAFKLREGMPIGCMVTVRRAKMYDFFPNWSISRCHAYAISAVYPEKLSTAAGIIL